MTEDRETNPENWRERAEAAEQKLQDALGRARQGLIKAALKSAALQAGMVDLDGIKLVDAEQIELNVDGEPVGVVPLMQRLQREKPWLFGRPSTSSGATPPAVQPPTQKRATEMNHDEWRLARAEMLRRR